LLEVIDSELDLPAKFFALYQQLEGFVDNLRVITVRAGLHQGLDRFRLFGSKFDRHVPASVRIAKLQQRGLGSSLSNSNAASVERQKFFYRIGLHCKWLPGDNAIDRLRRERYNRPPVIDGKGSFYKKQVDWDGWPVVRTLVFEFACGWCAKMTCE
jgi:hypothetical protein